jgi:hypothetical protein
MLYVGSADRTAWCKDPLCLKHDICCDPAACTQLADMLRHTVILRPDDSRRKGQKSADEATEDWKP